MFQPNYYTNQQIIRVNGENGARAFNLGANSSALLLDETAPLVWLAQTDGAGYKTVTPYEIKPYTPAPEPTLTDIMERIKKIEEKINVEPNTSKDDTKQSDDK